MFIRLDSYFYIAATSSCFLLASRYCIYFEWNKITYFKQISHEQRYQ